MPTLKAELSVSSLEKMVNDLEIYRQKIDTLPTRLTGALADYAAAQIEDNVAGVQAIDGNAPGRVWNDKYGAVAEVMLEGQQAGFFEFGTGHYADPHPKAAKNGWEYGVGEMIKLTASDRMMWRYYDYFYAQWRNTSGMQPQMPVFKAAVMTRAAVVPIAKELMK